MYTYVSLYIALDYITCTWDSPFTFSYNEHTPRPQQTLARATQIVFLPQQKYCFNRFALIHFSRKSVFGKHICF